jgi:hypothetical protein
MARLTPYLDDDTIARMRSAAEAAGMSVSVWVAHVVRERTLNGWPSEVVALAGAWPDLPTAEELRGR